MPPKIWWGILTAVIAVVAVGALVLLSANVGTAPSRGDGSLALAVHDAPCNACAHVYVTFSSVAVHQSNVSGSGWTTLSVTGQTVDLEALNGTALAKVIGVLSLPAGHYEQIRLSVSKVVVGFTNGTDVTAQIAGNGTAYIVGQFPVVAGSTTTVSIDIDLASSIHIEPGSSTHMVGTNPVTVVFTPRIGSAQVL